MDANSSNSSAAPASSYKSMADIHADIAATKTPKYCTNCKHIATAASGDVSRYKCFAPQNPFSVNLVDGSRIYEVAYCSEHRNIEPSNARCGRQGAWWEEKPAPTPAPAPYSAVPTPILGAAKAILKIKVGTNLIEDLGL
jgi:hypothetical protein